MLLAFLVWNKTEYAGGSQNNKVTTAKSSNAYISAGK